MAFSGKFVGFIFNNFPSIASQQPKEAAVEEPAEKPSMDLFKSIFADDSSSDDDSGDEEGEEEEKKEAVAVKSGKLLMINKVKLHLS